eukprot:TRINITY_DN46773_c0_g1_i1.p2 TRINITY_DN46773_c0_g1~~TRINITY_DN46773_c0_g1_i1.p2  ORF type:complete len:428 (+),score=120.35 TRINITY_DN46773_c0_g1_i1:90-1373(+)
MPFFAAGDNSSGQCGVQPARWSWNNVEPLPAAGLSVPGAVAASCGVDHVAVLQGDGQVLCAGANRHGQLGGGSRDAAEHPELVRVPLPWPAERVCCGPAVTAALERGGGRVCTWGDARFGMLGRECNCGAEPGEVEGLPRGDPVVQLEVFCGGVYCITAADQTWSWGTADGENEEPRRAPRQIAALSGRGIRRLAVCSDFAVAETASGKVLGWEVKQLSPLAEDTEEPPEVELGEGALPLRSLSAGHSHIAAVGANGKLWVWGKNRYGEVGNCCVRIPTPDTLLSSLLLKRVRPIKIPGDEPVASATAGPWFTVVTTESGKVLGSGNGQGFGLGKGVEVAEFTPVGGLPACRGPFEAHAGPSAQSVLYRWGWGSLKAILAGHISGHPGLHAAAAEQVPDGLLPPAARRGAARCPWPERPHNGAAVYH